MITLSTSEQVRMLTRIVENQAKRLCALERALAYRPSDPGLEPSLVPRITMRAIAETHATANGISLDQMVSADRHQNVSWPRQQAMAEMHRAGFSMPRIGRFFNRDHTTVLHAIKAVKARAG